MKDDYVDTGLWPESGVEVDEDVFTEFQTPPIGKMREPNSEGYPSWVDIPPPSPEALVFIAEQHKAALLNESQSIISIWQTQLQLGIIDSEDKVSLIAWMNYIKAVQKVDTSKAPNITWPIKPA